MQQIRYVGCPVRALILLNELKFRMGVRDEYFRSHNDLLLLFARLLHGEDDSGNSTSDRAGSQVYIRGVGLFTV